MLVLDTTIRSWPGKESTSRAKPRVEISPVDFNLVLEALVHMRTCSCRTRSWACQYAPTEHKKTNISKERYPEWGPEK